MSKVIEGIEQKMLRKVPAFGPGDRVKVHFQVIEGQRSRTQIFEGVVTKRQGHSARETFTVRKVSFGVGVERTFPVHSPKIEKIEIAARGDVSRSKLYYLRGRIGRRARIREQLYSEVAEEERALAVDEETETPASPAEEAEEQEEESAAVDEPAGEGDLEEKV